MQIKANDYNPSEIMKIVREWTELTQKEFGKTIGKSERTMQNYEGDLSNYTFKLLLEIAEKHKLEIIIKKK